MSLIAWLILGLIAGFIGSKIVNKTGEGVVVDVALGVLGAFVGGYVFQLLGMNGVTGFNIWSMIVAAFGAVLLLVGFHAVRRLA